MMNSVLIHVVRGAVIFVIGGICLAEFIGYFWHRFAEHNGYVGDVVRHHHWIHHELDYPLNNLCPQQPTAKARCGSWWWFAAEFLKSTHWLREKLGKGNGRICLTAIYKSSGSWTWYVVAIVTGILMFLILPLYDSLLLVAGGMSYSWFAINYFHAAFHIHDHWLQRFQWFRRLIRLHYIHHKVRANYGILFFGMDRLFGTFQPTDPPAKENIFPGYPSAPSSPISL